MADDQHHDLCHTQLSTENLRVWLGVFSFLLFKLKLINQALIRALTAPNEGIPPGKLSSGYCKLYFMSHYRARLSSENEKDVVEGRLFWPGWNLVGTQQLDFGPMTPLQ